MATDLARELLAAFYQKMVAIRLFEEKAAQLFYQGVIPGSILSSIGQEATAVGACSALRADDLMVSNHRALGHILAKGAPMDKVMAELLGKETGCNRGKGGAMHIIDMASGNLGADGVVGAGIPLTVGVGLAIKMKKRDQVVLCFFGDGAVNTGAFHEGLNMAAIWRLPVIFVCENNQYAISTRPENSSLVKDLAERASAYGIPGITVDGNDVLEVYQAVRPAVEGARVKSGPQLIETRTYRWRGYNETEQHYLVGERAYRTEDEIKQWIKRCPIKRLKGYLLEKELFSQDEINAWEANTRKEVDEAASFAIASPGLPPERARQDLFFEAGS